MLDSLDLAIRNAHIFDGGPFYHEFHADQLIKEPWNTYSSLLFFVPIVFWLIKLRGQYANFKIILLLLLLLFLNGLGSTLYHAFRSTSFFLILDSLPAAMMSFSLASYFWSKIFRNTMKGLGMVLLIFISGYVLIKFLVSYQSLKEMGPNMAYLIVGLTFFIPILIILVRTNWFKFKQVLATLVFLILALLFRILDHPSDRFSAEHLPQGTHFLWHIFSVFAVFTLGYYVYYLERDKKSVFIKTKFKP